MTSAATPSSNGMKNGGSASNGPKKHKRPLYVEYPTGSSWEFTLSTDELVSGTVYCTDEVAESVVVQKSLVHTTLQAELRILSASAIVQANKLGSVEEGGSSSEGQTSSTAFHPLPKIQKKFLEDRERKAIQKAEESFRHINQKASPEGQAVFDRLLKACNEVVWKGESILVLNQIQVDPPYGPEQCRMKSNGKQGALEDSSLDRVKKIVAANTGPAG